jgi:hypothetical protein
MQTETRLAPRPMFDTTTCDLAISAVASDHGFVAELIADIAQRLRTTPSWRVATAVRADEPEPALDSPVEAVVGIADSRVVLVLHHHLWNHDEQMRRDELVLRQRISERPSSVCVIALDDIPLPKWLARAPHYDMTAGGRAGAADFVLNTIAAAGGAVAPKPVVSDAVAPSRWPEAPAPFLAQPRAQSALRHQLDALGEELESVVDRCKLEQPDRLFELQILPNRLVARLDDVAVSFSWLTSGSTSIADGRLLVIAWRDVATGVRGPAALKSAAMMHERSYAADGGTPDTWCWRGEDASRQAYSSADLAAAWIARISIARSA